MQTKPRTRPITVTTRREATVVYRFVETTSETYDEPTPSELPSRPGLAKCAAPVTVRRAGVR